MTILYIFVAVIVIVFAYFIGKEVGFEDGRAFVINTNKKVADVKAEPAVKAQLKKVAAKKVTKKKATKDKPTRKKVVKKVRK